ncbi:lipopolysaccharide export system ATP-binding protein [Chryseobacterium sp. SORGH_AS909]|uniref:Lipopolysaccharide export system ATP-binding protein LptB n=1 Tax=Chryseobacterium camelliae TaxID=1265445 RepID=A0ABU0TGA6_9FLAO|nr:lipopolysaccharide export system ATP-binding protein [Chryseobacterium camelliae]MDQ1099101.1 lipopolysaccharide export system ATP-binding protein [Chryseobacterium sp. SORGH_AS_1048]MDR6086450.1 lipopolysaccharide export system ATP-binding protein [Chryseobacterium sp. SORGH_AS_0909]MDR6130822.1 lipopolysaccharide export system ATP-binding protein [Chryseobacterium sp. SORGH_AS_1175]MDT3407046.1 lipopolysaccharide export system ATP-binding protein [Pseudacidovorax intermedius]
MILRGENLIKEYGPKKVVKGVSVQVQQGEIVGLLGPNGAGKTTSFYMIVGLVKPTSGKIFLDKQEITTDAMYRRAQKGIGYLAQEASVFRKLSVEENIMGVLQLTKLSKREQQMKCDELVEEFSLQHVRKNRGDLLSGGERRRTEIARCLATSPNFILLDEPFAGVDPIAVEDIQKIVRSLVDKNIGILITDHNVQQTLAITNKTYIMFEGRILKEGLPEELANDPQVREAYLGENFVYQSLSDKSKKKKYLYNIWAGNFDSKTQLQSFVDENFSQFDDLRTMHGFEDISFASLANSEIEHIFNDVIDKNANNAYVFQKKEINSQYSKEQAEAESKAAARPELHYVTTYVYEG